MSTKVCAVCGFEKSVEVFWKRSSSPDGHSETCSECAGRKYRKRNYAYPKGDPTFVPLVKECTKCRRTKHVDAFYKGAARLGRQSRCIDCTKTRDASRRTPAKAVFRAPVAVTADPPTKADLEDARRVGMRLTMWGIR